MIFLLPRTPLSFHVTVRNKGGITVYEGHASTSHNRATVILTTGLGDTRHRFATRLEDVVQDAHWAQVDFVTPIHFLGSKAPGVLGEISRSNWLDIHLYFFGKAGPKKVFEFSSRDPDSVQWKVKAGKLAGITVYDSFATPKPPREPRGKRWVQVTGYSWNAKLEDFVQGTPTWKALPFGHLFPKQEEHPPKRFSFGWKTKG